MLGFSMVHVGINAQNGEEALAVAKLFNALFGFPLKDGNMSVFPGEQIEA
ncbi:MAG: hypothetical protein LBB68_11575 [Treponema sp.]|jgi:2-dehydro-3-deoxyphosphogluconate aldolase/(4S)-4-hydroxy-2-oxoglutarate aldolase|nr:hypothetical protein [Treponema sp.]